MGSEKRTNDQELDSHFDWIVSLFMLILYTLLSFFVAAKAELGYWDLSVNHNWWTPRLDIYVLLAYILWLIVQCVLYVVPIGGRLVFGRPIKDKYRLKYRLNGLFVLTVNIIAFIIALMSGVRVTAIADNVVELVTGSVVFLFCLSVILYMRGMPRHTYDINPAANRGNVIHDWIFGRSLNPRIGELDVKFIIFRSAVIASVLYNFSMLSKFYESGNSTNMTLLLAVGLQLMYMIDTMWYESELLGLREIHSEGCGSLYLITSILVPVGYGIVINFIARTNYSLQLYWMLLILAIYAFGYCMFRKSNEEKNLFTLNPDNEAFNESEIMMTSSGKNLLDSRWWGICRHPDCLGEIILNFAISFPAGFSHSLLYLNPAMLLFFVLDQESQYDNECKKKYGDVWDQHCRRVKYKLVPYVY